MSDGIGVTPDELSGMARSLEGSLDALNDAAAQPPVEVDAGATTPLVEEVFGIFYSALAGLAAGVDQVSREVTASREQYARDDQAAAEGLPPLPLGDSDSDTPSLPVFPGGGSQ